MRVLAIVHQRDAGLGVFEGALAASGAAVETWRPAEERPPRLDGEGDSGCDAAIVLGGAVHPDQADEHPWLAGERALVAGLLERGAPVLGVCLGAQLLAQAAGGSVRRLPRADIGWRTVELATPAGDDPVVGGLPSGFESFQWHSYETLPPAGSVELARDATCLQAYRLADAPAWGIQFHAEVTAAIVEGWLASYADDPDAVAAGLDPDGLRERTRALVDAQGRLGRELCKRFLAVAAGRGGATPA